MKVAVSCVWVIVAVALLAASNPAQQQSPDRIAAPNPAQQQSAERKPVPSFSNDDILSGPRSVSVERPNDSASDSWSKSVSAWPLLKSVSARLKMDSPNGPVSALVEAVQPDRFHMSTNGFEIITIGSEMYTRMQGGAWERRQANSSQAFSLKGFMADEFLKGGTPKLIGAEKIGGIDTDVYDVASALGVEGTSRVWIGKSDGLPRKLTGNVAGMSMNVTFYDFNKADISIKSPM